MLLKLTLFFSAFTTLAGIHLVALKFFLYWKYAWFDIPMHTLGGVCVALGISILPFFNIQLPPSYRTLTAYIVAVLVVGMLWEIFEMVAGIAFFDDEYVVDTFIDICMDIVGVAIGYGILTQVNRLNT